VKRAYFNNYPSKISVTEVISKEARTLVKRIANRLKAGENPKTLLCFPDLPGSRTTLYKIASELGINLRNKFSIDASLAIYYENNTLRTHDSEIMQILHRMKVINLLSRDISKDKVDSDFEQVFGYSTRINPLDFQGIALEKSLENAKHDGKPIKCPIETINPACIYQRIIDNSSGLNEVADIRVPIVGTKIPHVYLKYKLQEHRYTNKVHRSTFYAPTELLSQDEILLILEFAKQSKLDFGELDVLRDKNDGRIYIVDVNNTPYGPPAGLSANDHTKSVKSLALAFKEEFLV